MIFNSMKLKDYFTKYNVKISGFAKSLGTTRQTIYRILNGMIPKPSLAKKIEEVTEERVTAMELLFPEDHKDHEK